MRFNFVTKEILKITEETSTLQCVGSMKMHLKHQLYFVKQVDGVCGVDRDKNVSASKTCC